MNGGGVRGPVVDSAGNAIVTLAAPPFIGQPMRATAITAACLILLAGAVAKAPTANTAFADVDAKQQILDLEQVWVTAEHNHDAARLRRILDNKFVATFGGEKPMDKEAFIKVTVRGDVDSTESQTLADRNVIIDQDTAVSVGTDTESGTNKGKAYTAVARYTVTYIRRNGQWVALAEHLAEVPQAK